MRGETNFQPLVTITMSQDEAVDLCQWLSVQSGIRASYALYRVLVDLTEHHQAVSQHTGASPSPEEPRE